MTIWIQTNAILQKSTLLIRVLHHKLSSSIIYSDNLSHGFGSWGHSQYALVFAVTCMEQLNAQKHPANQGKAMKAFLCLCSNSLTHHFLSFSSAHNEAMHSLYITPLFQLNPPVNLLHDWVGTISAWRGRIGDDGREMDTPLVSFFILTGPSLQTRSWKWEGRPQLPLCKVLCVYTSPPTRKRWRGVQGKKRIETGRCLVKQANKENVTHMRPRKILHILSWRHICWMSWWKVGNARTSN